jgi:hypothetical protein
MEIFRKWSLAFGVVLWLSACGGSIPSAKTAQSVAESYFKSYGNRYKTSPFAGKNLARVTINQIEEISYKNAQVDAQTNLKDGHALRVLIKMENKLPGGWRVDSWEILENQ